MDGMLSEGGWAEVLGDSYTASWQLELPARPTIAQLSLVGILGDTVLLGFTGCSFADAHNVLHTEVFPSITDWNGVRHFARNGLMSVVFQMWIENSAGFWLLNLFFWDG